MKKTNLVLIDADGLIYHSSKDLLQQSVEILDEKINNILLQTQADEYILFISEGRYFRSDISEDYKSNRKKYPSQLKWLKTLKNYLKEEWNAFSMQMVESDDLCAFYLKTPPEGYNAILASPDKDLLQAIPSVGKGHFNYTYKIKEESKGRDFFTDDDLIKGWWVQTSESEAHEFRKMQMIVGDTADSIKSIEGRGEAYWKKISKDTIPSWGDILQEYIVKYGETLGIYNFQKSYRMLHLLETESEFITEVGYIPQLPEFQKVINSTKEEIKIDF
jgi:5'-3' exonuclease